MTTTTTADPHANQEDIVIEVLKDFPDNVAAFACHGHLTKTDYETVLIPHIEEKLNRHKRLRGYTEIAPDFVGVDPGALWEDTKVGFSHFFDWERAALVTDVEWMSRATKFFSFLIPGDWRVFPTAEVDKARVGCWRGSRRADEACPAHGGVDPRSDQHSRERTARAVSGAATRAAKSRPPRVAAQKLRAIFRCGERDHAPPGSTTGRCSASTPAVVVG